MKKTLPFATLFVKLYFVIDDITVSIKHGARLYLRAEGLNLSNISLT